MRSEAAYGRGDCRSAAHSNRDRRGVDHLWGALLLRQATVPWGEYGMIGQGCRLARACISLADTAALAVAHDYLAGAASCTS